jgi:hypothetical protein
VQLATFTHLGHVEAYEYLLVTYVRCEYVLVIYAVLSMQR